MRTEKSIKNAATAIISNSVAILASFAAQAIFIKTLGKEYNGLNGLFSNIISMLSVFELGLGSALVYHLYEPIAKKDKEKIKSIMRFYRNSYRAIAATIALLSIALLPFLHFFVTSTIDINIYIVFLLFAADSSFSYLLSYKRSILYANQESYILNIIRIGYTLLLNTAQIIILLLTKNYYLYLIIKIVSRIAENLAITLVSNKRYPELKSKKVNKLGIKTKRSIYKKVKGLLFHKIGSYIVLGTDNIIISKFIDLATVGLYANYTIIINGINALFSQIFYSITSSIGNLLTEKNSIKSYSTYRQILLINFWIACFSCIAFYLISRPFISIWIGDEYLLNDAIVISIMINLYLTMYGNTIGSFKAACGIFHEDRFVPLIQSVVNIIVSIALVKPLGLAGVVIGTIISTMILYLFSYPRYVYSRLFNKKIRDYYMETAKYAILFAIIFIISNITYNVIVSNCKISSLPIQLVVATIISLLLPSAIIVAIYGHSQNFTLIKKIVRRKHYVK